MAIHAVERLKDMDKRKTSALGVICLIFVIAIIFILRAHNTQVKFLPGDIEAIYRTFEKLDTAIHDGSFDGLNGLFDDGGYSENLIESTEAPNTTTTPKPTEAPTTPKPTEPPTTLKPTKAPTTPKPTKAPTTPKPTKAPTTPKPTKAPTTPKPTKAPTTPKPTKAPTTSTTTKAPTTPKPTKAPTTSTTTKAPTTPKPTKAPTTPKPTKAPTTPKPTKAPTTSTTTKATTTPTTARRTPAPRPQSRVGEPLILTPFLESGQDAYARQRASVNLTEFPTVESYAGYFTVNVNYNSNLFFWYFPATEVRSADAPVVLFLEGMLGMSALASLFLKNGPFEMGPERRPRKRWDSLNRKHNMIYIDSPVGAGYSYMNSDQVSPTPTQISDEVYEAMRQFFEMFPDLLKNKFFVTGESLAGQFIPLVAWRIHERNQRLPAYRRINLQGIAIGNGWVDPKNQLIWGENLHNIGLVDDKEREDLRQMEKRAQDYINNGYEREATSVIEQIVWSRDSLFRSLTGYQKVFNFLDPGDKSISLSFVAWITSENVRLALHVGANRFEPISRNVQTRLRYDMTRSVAYVSSILLGHYRVLIYTGELDIFCSYLSVQNWLGKLEWSGAMQFRNARKAIWQERGKLVGYTRRHGNLIEVLVRNAGHFSSIDQPQWTRELLEHFTHGEPF